MTIAHATEHELDLALAAELQAALLPKDCPGLRGQQAAFARNRMCDTIGGDFIDFIPLNADQTAVVIGDVVGHGVRSSLLMAQIIGFLRSGDPRRRCRPTAVGEDLNRMLIELGNRVGSVLPCSLFYAVIDGPSGTVLHLNAGHPRPLLFSRDDGPPLPLPARNMLLGVEEFPFEEECFTFTAGQRLVLYTDGLVDAAGGDGRDADDRFGDANLLRLLSEHRHDTPEQTTNAVFAAIDAFRQGQDQRDDETIVVVDRI